VSKAAAGVRELAAKLSAIVADAAIERARESLIDFSEVMPILKLAGYAVSEVSVELGLPPKIVASFESLPPVPEKDVEALFQRHEHELIATTIIRALVRARKLQDSVKVGDFKPKGLSLSVSVPPSIVVRFG
jgi:hypothetical protein